MFKVNINKKQGMNFYSADIDKLRFIDSCNMLKGALSKIAKHHILNKGDVTLVKASMFSYSSEVQNLLLSSGKQFLPYEYINSLDKLNETCLPQRNAFSQP